jgi:hypothetical protein
VNSVEIINRENGPSGRMYLEKYVKKNYPDVFNDVIEFCNDKFIDLPFKEKVYHYVNDLKDFVYCSNPNCEKTTNFKNSTLGYNNYCSNACISSDPNIKKTKENKSYEKFGTKAPGMNDVVKKKMIKTNQERYGSNCPLQNDEVQNKSKETLFKNYGVDNPNKSEEIVDRSKKTCMINYGVDNPKKNKEINDKIKNTMMLRYGVEYAMQNDEIKIKAIENFMTTLAKNIRELYKEYEILEIDSKNKKYKMICENGHIFDIDYTLLNSRRRIHTLICTECNPLNSSISGLEIELSQFIHKNYNGSILLNDRTLIDRELDIYLPELKLAFEFNGLWWHNELNKSSDYHLKKTDDCESKGVRLIHVWEDDWQHNKNVVKSMILNLLKKTENKIYARKCVIKNVDSKTNKEFLENNHIQGSTVTKINIGLYYNDELVSLMNFGKKRIVMNDKSDVGEWELSRFCNKINTNVIGGASKLFKHFTNNYNPTEIITYANRSYSNGDLYKTLNFEFLYKTDINYYYIVNKIRKHRFSFRKATLVKDGYDKNKTEKEIMLERKIYRIYDSGQLKFIWKI